MGFSTHGREQLIRDELNAKSLKRRGSYFKRKVELTEAAKKEGIEIREAWPHQIKAIKEKTENENFFPEDRYFTVVKKILVNPAPFKLANKFSVEKFYYEKPFGVHKFWEYLDQNMINKLLNNNKNLSLLKKYYLL